MPIWYNQPAKDSKFANFAISKWEEVNSKLTFKELGIKDDDSFYYLFGHCEAATDLNFVKGGREWKFEPQLVTFKVAKKDYEKWDMNDRKNVPMSQSPLEKLLTKAFSGLDLEKVYSGKLVLQDTPQIEMILNNKGFDDEPLGEKMTKAMMASIVSLEAVESPEIIKLAELEAPKKQGYGNKASGQSEYDKCTDRLKFVAEQLKVVFPDNQLTSIADIASVMSDEKTKDKFFELWAIMPAFIGGEK